MSSKIHDYNPRTNHVIKLHNWFNSLKSIGMIISYLNFKVIVIRSKYMHQELIHQTRTRVWILCPSNSGFIKNGFKFLKTLHLLLLWLKNKKKQREFKVKFFSFLKVSWKPNKFVYFELGRKRWEIYLRVIWDRKNETFFIFSVTKQASAILLVSKKLPALVQAELLPFSFY